MSLGTLFLWVIVPTKFPFLNQGETSHHVTCTCCPFSAPCDWLPVNEENASVLLAAALSVLKYCKKFAYRGFYLFSAWWILVYQQKCQVMKPDFYVLLIIPVRNHYVSNLGALEIGGYFALGTGEQSSGHTAAKPRCLVCSSFSSPVHGSVLLMLSGMFVSKQALVSDEHSYQYKTEMLFCLYIIWFKFIWKAFW